MGVRAPRGGWGVKAAGGQGQRSAGDSGARGSVDSQMAGQQRSAMHSSHALQSALLNASCRGTFTPPCAPQEQQESSRPTGFSSLCHPVVLVLHW